MRRKIVFNVEKPMFIEKIEDWFRSLKQGSESLWMWFPIIWKDRQWDHQYIYVVFRHKLHLTEQLIRHHGHHVNNIADADKIKVCINLLDRLMKDEYHETAFKRHEEKWGPIQLNWKDSKDHPNMCEAAITYPNVKTDKDKKLETKDFRNASKAEAALRQQDIDLLFEMMQKHIQTWWD